MPILIKPEEVNVLSKEEQIEAFENKFVKELPDGTKKFSIFQVIANLKEILTLIIALIANFKK